MRVNSVSATASALAYHRDVVRIVALVVGIAVAGYALHVWHRDESDPPICCPSGVPGDCHMENDAQAQQCMDELNARDSRNATFDRWLIVGDIALVIAIVGGVVVRRRSATRATTR